MGACSFFHKIDGPSAGECFDILVQAAYEQSGHDPYNGTISTCTLGRVHRVADVCTPAVEKKVHKMIEDDDYGRKWVATCLDLGLVGYEVITVKKVATKPAKAAKYLTKYVVIEEYTKTVSHHDTKTEAENAAMKAALAHPENDYTVCKRPVNMNRGDDCLTRLEVTKTMKKTKPKTTKQNAHVRAIHRYVFYGMAAE